MMNEQKNVLGLQRIPKNNLHPFVEPGKRINEGYDVSSFLISRAYADLITFMLQLNASMFPRKMSQGSSETAIAHWDLGSSVEQGSAAAQSLASLLACIGDYIAESPPDPGPRRFGNASFRKWYSLVESRVDDLLVKYLPGLVQIDHSQALAAQKEIRAYFMGSFGSSQRLDYGTGHELSFLAFLGCIWKLGGFKSDRGPETGHEERAIVLGIIDPYVGQDAQQRSNIDSDFVIVISRSFAN